MLFALSAIIEMHITPKPDILDEMMDEMHKYAKSKGIQMIDPKSVSIYMGGVKMNNFLSDDNDLLSSII